MTKKDYDFSGWATVHGVKCSDGRIIHKDAFKDNDGKTVPLVWNHDHNEASNVLGHASLENKEKGVYAFCSFNDTEQGKHAKELVKHGDICSLSIYANKLVQKGSDVMHGMIREVSLVLAGANPGAYIDNVILHGSVSDEEAHIFNSEEEIEIILHNESSEKVLQENDKSEIEKDDPAKEDKKVEEKKMLDEKEIKHKAEGEETVQDIFNSLNEKQKNLVYIILAKVSEDEDESDPKKVVEEVQHAETPAGEAGKEETLQDIFNSLNEKQKTMLYIMISEVLDQKSNKEDNKEIMKQNAFENEKEKKEEEMTLTHSDLLDVIATAKKGSSLRDAFNEACISHGVTNIDLLFPDNKAVPGSPKVVDENNDWVAVVMGGVKHTPFSRIKSTYFDITGEDARALGYVKGEKKVEEVIIAAKRTTDPQTVYKLQKFDRDDIVDVVDFDVIAWIKNEMRAKLEVELARAILFGDGRSAVSHNKIDPLHIRNVLSDSDVYSIPVAVSGTTSEQIAESLIDQMVIGQLNYKGSGNITAFVRDDLVTRMLLLKDLNKHRLYKSIAELATAMNVSRVVKVPASIMGSSCYAIALDLSDYNVGADRGGAVSMFDDFDINYNKMEYLIETRCSGANVTPYSAMVFSAGPAASDSSSK